jgi:prophage tail gpP-like protein
VSAEPKHRVTVTVEGKTIGGWTEYEISSSMVEAADAFTMRRPFDAESWKLLERDSRIRVEVDGAPILEGFIDGRRKRKKEGTLEVRGRDRAGRLVQESAPRINYQGLELTEAIKRLADPWFSKVTLSDARNRRLRLGKSRRIPAGNEPIIVRRSASGNGRVQPGTMRWAVIEELVSDAGLIAWSSADGKELFVGRPNHDQAPSFHILNANKAAPWGSGMDSNCRDLDYDEDNGDRYSLIACVGTGGGTVEDWGISVSSRRAYVTDNADNLDDGTGRDFKYPKRLLLPEKSFDSNDDASRIADMPYHGQWFGPTATLFAPNTVASVTDEDFDPPMREDFMIIGCQYRRNRKDGETTLLELVPVGTEIVL